MEGLLCYVDVFLREAIRGEGQEGNQQERQEYAEAVPVLSLAGKHSRAPEHHREVRDPLQRRHVPGRWGLAQKPGGTPSGIKDRKSTRLNSSHANISYAVFCLKKKKNHPL